MVAAWWRKDLAFLLILATALVLRLYLATTAPYIHDEENTSIPLAQKISFVPGHLHLPIRAVNHPALPAYFVKISGILFPRTPLGYRLVHVLVGLVTIVVVFRLTHQWYGPVAARWAAALLAFNEYYLAISARATSQAPYLLFVALAVYAFGRFLRTERAGYLYAAGLSASLAFYCKEHAALLLPVFFLTLLHAKYRHTLRGPHVYLACALFFLVIGPDIAWNLNADPEIARVTYGDRDVAQATYGRHLQRIGGIAFSPYPFVFYGRHAVMGLYALITGQALDDNTPEYASMNPALGVLLLGAVLMMSYRGAVRNHLRRFLLVWFWSVFGLFMLIRPGNPEGLDPVSWIWADVTLLPAVILAGAWLAGATGKLRTIAWVFSAAALLYAGAWMVAQ